MYCLIVWEPAMTTTYPYARSPGWLKMSYWYAWGPYHDGDFRLWFTGERVYVDKVNMGVISIHEPELTYSKSSHYIINFFYNTLHDHVSCSRLERRIWQCNFLTWSAIICCVCLLIHVWMCLTVFYITGLSLYNYIDCHSVSLISISPLSLYLNFHIYVFFHKMNWFSLVKYKSPSMMEHFVRNGFVLIFEQ